MPGRGTTNAIFIFYQLQEKYIQKKENRYYSFVDLEKAFDRVRDSVLWWTMRKLKIEEWFIEVEKSIYNNGNSKVTVSCSKLTIAWRRSGIFNVNFEHI